jgi:hypothetical protein
VYGYHKLPGVSEGEWVEYYRPTALRRLRQDLTKHASLQLRLFSTSYEYAEYSCAAEYDGPWESLDESEIALFKLALRVEDREMLFEECIR